MEGIFAATGAPFKYIDVALSDPPTSTLYIELLEIPTVIDENDRLLMEFAFVISPVTVLYVKKVLTAATSRMGFMNKPDVDAFSGRGLAFRIIELAFCKLLPAAKPIATAYCCCVEKPA